MQVAQVWGIVSVGLAGGTGWMLYTAVWRHAPERFPRSVDEWWAWFRGANREIAAQHSGGSTPDPIPPANPAQLKEGKQ
jgi:hypothetical protein